MSPFCYIKLGWAVNGIKWNIGAYDIICKGETGETDPLHRLTLMACAALQVASPAMTTTSLDIILFQLLASSIPTVACNDGLTGPCWQNFSQLRSKGKQTSYMMNGSEPHLISLWKEMLFFFFFASVPSDKWGWNETGMTWLEERWIKGFPYVSINTKCCFDICYPPGEQNWSCHKVIRGWIGEHCACPSTKCHR